MLAPITVGHDGGAMTFLTEATKAPVKLAWPSGWSARLIGGRAKLVNPDGVVFLPATAS